MLSSDRFWSQHSQRRKRKNYRHAVSYRMPRLFSMIKIIDGETPSSERDVQHKRSICTSTVIHIIA